MIQAKVDSYLLLEESSKVARIRSGKWSPSSFGKCYRAQYWNRLNEPKTNPVGVEALRRFKLGNLIHKLYQDILKGEYIIEAKVETENCLGFADLVGQDEVVDIKSVRSFQYKLMQGKKKPYDFKEEKKDNILQVTFYGIYLGKSKGRLIFVDKDSLESIEFEFNIDEFRKKLEEELEMLNGYWKIQKLPPSLPRCYNGKECQYCSWMDKCKGELNGLNQD